MSKNLSILIFAKSEKEGENIRRPLVAAGYTLNDTRASTAAGLAKAMRKPGWQAVIAPFTQPDKEILNAVSAAREANNWIPFIILAEKIDPKTAVELMRAGAADVVLAVESNSLGEVIERESKVSREKQEEWDILAAAQENEALLEEIFQSVNDGIGYASPKGVILAVNDALLKITGLSRDDLIGKSVFDITRKILTPKIAADVLPQLVKVVKLDHVDPFIVHYQGKILHVTVMAKKRSKFLTGVVRDITESRQAEGQLRESEERFRLMFEGSPLGFQSLDIDGNFIDVNPAWLAVLGYTSDEVIGRWFGDFLIPAQKPLFQKRFPYFKNAGEIRDAEFEMVRKDGSVVSVSFDGKIGHTPDGKFRQTYCLLKDITDRKKAEETLNTSLNQLNSMLANSATVISILKKDGRITYISPNIEKWFGWKPEEFIGTNGWKNVRPRDLLKIKSISSALLLSDGASKTFEYQFKCKDGSYKLIELTATNMLNDPVIQGILLNYHDITAQREEEETHRAIEDRYTKAFEASPDSININRLKDGMYVDINSGFTKMTGFTWEDVEGKTALDINIWVNPADRKRLVDIIKAEGKVSNFEAPFRKKDGGILIGSMSANPIEINGEICHLSITRDITAIRTAEAAQRASEEKFKLAFLTSPDSININRMSDGLYIEVNDGFLKLTGYTRAEVIGKTSAEINIWSKPEDREKLIKGLRENGNVPNLEADFRIKDGSLKSCLMSANIIEVDGEKCILSITRDFSEQHKLVSALRNSEDKFRKAFQISPDAISISSTSDGRFIEINDSFLESTGFTRSEVIGQSAGDLNLWIDPELRVRLMKELQEHGKVPNTESVIRRKNGETVDVLMSASLIEISGETCVLTITRDISEQKKANEAIRVQSTALETAANAVTITDERNRITWANRAFYEMSGYTEEDTKGKRLADLVRSNVHDADFYQNISDTILSRNPWHGVIYNRRKNGEIYPEEMTVTPIMDEDGKITSFISVKQDITDKKRIADILNSRLHLLEYAASHEVEDVMQETLAEAEKLTGSISSFYHFLEPDQQTINLQTWSRNTLDGFCKVEGMDPHYPISEAGVWVDCVPQRKPVIHNDYGALAHRKGLPPGHLPISREAVIPVFRQEKIVAVLGIGNKETDYTNNDVEIVSQLADLAWDITESLLINRALKDSENRYRGLFNNAAVPTLVEDFSGVKAIFNELQMNGVKNLRNHIQQNPEIVEQCAESIRILEANITAVKFFGLTSKEDLLIKLPTYFTDSSWNVFKEEIIALSEGKTHFISDMSAITSTGEERLINLQIFIDPAFQNTMERVLVSFVDITNRHQAEQSLKESEERFRSYVENASDIVYSLNSEGIITYVSPKITELLGYQENELVGHSFMEITHADDHQACNEFLQKVFSSSEKQSGLEFRLRHKNGEWIWHTTNATPINDENGNTTSFLGIAYDIKQRKAAEDALNIERKKAQNYLDIADVMLVAFGTDQKISLINRRGCQILGYSEDELLGQNWFDNCLPERLKKEVKEEFNKLLRGKMETEDYFENPVLTRSGEERMIGWHNAPILDDHGNITGVISSGEDITDRKRIESDLLESKQKLEKAQSHAHIGSWTWNIKSNSLDWSDEMFHIFGLNRDTFTGFLPDVVNQAIHPDDREAVEASNRSVAEKGKPIPLEYRIIRPDGTVRTVWAEAGEMELDEKGNPSKLSGIVQDITDRKLAEQIIRESEALLNETQRVSKLGGWEWNVAKQTMTWSREVYRIHGISPDEVILDSRELDRRSEACYLSEDRQKIIDLFNECESTGQPYEVQARFTSETGEQKWVSTSGEGHWENGKVARITGNIMDITERKQAEIALRESEERYQSLVETAPIGIYIAMNGKYVFANPAGLETLGFDNLNEIVGIELTSVVHPVSIQKVIKRIKDAEQGTANPPIELKVIKQNGDSRFVESISTPFKMDGEPGVLILSQDITARKAAENELTKQEQKLSNILEGTRVGTWEWNVQTGVARVDANSAAIIGYTSEELPIMTFNYWMSLKHPLDRQASNEELLKHLRGETDFYSYETRMWHKDGYWVWVLGQGKVVSWDKGDNPLWVLGTHMDITKSKKSEELLRKSEALLNEAQQLSKIGAWEWDIATQVLTWSDEVYRIHDIQKDDVDNTTGDFINRSINCYLDNDKDRITEAFNKCVHYGIPYEIDAEFISELGVRKWIRTIGRAEMENGKVIRVSGNIMDITDQKLADEEIKDRESVLEEAQKIAHLGSYLLDLETRQTTWSKETFRIFGLDENTKALSNTEFSRVVHPDDRDLESANFYNSVSQGLPFDMVYRIVRPDGETRFVHSLGHPEKNEAGEIVRFVGSIQDITESKVLEMALQNSLDEQEVLLREVHHRVKNNLASILGLLEMERQFTSDPSSDTLLMELGNRIKSMATIHEKLYRAPSLSKIDFDDYLRSFISHLRTSIKPAFEIETIVKTGNVELSLDLAVPCGLIVNELVTNAMKYAFPQGKPRRDGGEVCQIVVRMTARETAYTLTVADNGVGLSPKFNWREAKSLGLRLVTMLGEHQLGGKISLDRSSGTKFTLKFDPRNRM